MIAGSSDTGKGGDGTRRSVDGATQEDSVRGRSTALRAAKPYLFVVLEGDRPLAGGARFDLEDVDEIVVGRGTARTCSRDDADGVRRLVLRLPSPSLSGVHARLRRTPDGWIVEDDHSKNGSYFNGQRVNRAMLSPEDLLEVGHVFLMIRSYPRRLDDHASGDLDAASLEGLPAALRTLVPTDAARLDELRRFALSSVSILIWGETGTGKEVLSRAIHELSGRTGALVAVNCSTLTEGLAESQLFGHVRGAFSGAVVDSLGFVRAAEGGTLLLDEVGDLVRPAQGALLRVLQEREVVPVGSARARQVDVRFIATSPRPLGSAMKQDRFRSDLFARLAGFVHAMTPLRQRREDTGLLVASLLHKAGVTDGAGPRITPEMGLELLRYAWPLNVRELEQTLVRSWLLADRGLMDTRKLEAEHGDDGEAPGSPARLLSAAEQETRARLVEQLTAARGNVTQAARSLGLGRVQVHRLMRRLAIDPARYRG